MKPEEAIRILGETTLCTPLGQAAFVGVEAIKHVIDLRSKIDSGELVKVVHGRWKTIRGNFITGGGNPMWGCSKCNELMWSSMSPPNYKYCPHCGAKMDSK